MARTLKLQQAKRLIRCSSLPLLFDCPPAVLNPDKLTVVRVKNGAENLGTEIHAAIQQCIETGTINLDKIKRLFKTEDVDRAQYLFHNGLRVVEQARRDMKNPQFEVEVSFETETYSVIGHVDILDCYSDRAYVVDFKTGRTRDDHYHQMVGYAVGAWTKMGRPKTFTVFVAYAYLEDQNDITSFELTADDMTAWLKELDTLEEKRYTVNRRCVYCPLQNDCKAYASFMKGAIRVLRQATGDSEHAITQHMIRKLKPEDLTQLSMAAKTVDMMVKRWRDQVKAEALERGEISLGNGNRYEIKMFKTRTLLTNTALPILAKYVTPKALAAATKLDLNSLLTSAVKGAKGPMKALLRAEIEKKLDKAGAVVYTESPRLETTNEKGTRWLKKKNQAKAPSPTKRR